MCVLLIAGWCSSFGASRLLVLFVDLCVVFGERSLLLFGSCMLVVCSPLYVSSCGLLAVGFCVLCFVCSELFVVCRLVLDFFAVDWRSLFGVCWVVLGF